MLQAKGNLKSGKQIEPSWRTNPDKIDEFAKLHQKTARIATAKELTTVEHMANTNIIEWTSVKSEASHSASKP
ncbi:hypothetical protein [Roseibium album]|uniref:hypothetical protein n=1 Tax=Roseibium album TaxID=311410 RepID=UPI003BB0E6A9